MNKKITGIILAGGESTRMGQEKAFITINGVRLIDRAASILSHFCDSILISSNNRKLENLGFQLVRDEYRSIGPIAGLFSGFKAAWTDHYLVIPCDTPFVSTVLYNRILEHIDEYSAVIAGTSDDLIEPLIGYYHRSAQSVLADQIRKKDYKIQNVLKRLPTKIEIFTDKNFFMNINARSDLALLPLQNQSSTPCYSLHGKKDAFLKV